MSDPYMDGLDARMDAVELEFELRHKRARKNAMAQAFAHIEANEFDKAQAIRDQFHITDEEWDRFVWVHAFFGGEDDA